MSVTTTITCDDGCGKTISTTTDAAGTGWLHVIWYATAGTEELDFVNLKHMRQFMKDFKDPTDPATP